MTVTCVRGLTRVRGTESPIRRSILFWTRYVPQKTPHFFSMPKLPNIFYFPENTKIQNTKNTKYKKYFVDFNQNKIIWN